MEMLKTALQLRHTLGPASGLNHMASLRSMTYTTRAHMALADHEEH